MGKATATNAFARLFMLPGVSHCAGGDGPDSFNGLGALVNWVEEGQAPSVIITSKVTGGKVTETRPVFQYPLVAVDTTGGPVNKASSLRQSAPGALQRQHQVGRQLQHRLRAGLRGPMARGLPARKGRSSVSTRAARVQSDPSGGRDIQTTPRCGISGADIPCPGSEALGVV